MGPSPFILSVLWEASEEGSAVRTVGLITTEQLLSVQNANWGAGLGERSFDSLSKQPYIVAMQSKMKFSHVHYTATIVNQFEQLLCHYDLDWDLKYSWRNFGENLPETMIFDHMWIMQSVCFGTGLLSFPLHFSVSLRQERPKDRENNMVQSTHSKVRPCACEWMCNGEMNFPEKIVGANRLAVESLFSAQSVSKHQCLRTAVTWTPNEAPELVVQIPPVTQW